MSESPPISPTPPVSPTTPPPPLTREQMLSAADRTFEEVSVPEWGGSARVRSLTAGEREHARTQAKDNPDTPASAFFVAQAVCDAQGQRVFTDHDVFALADKNARAIERIADRALRLSSIGAQERESAKNG